MEKLSKKEIEERANGVIRLAKAVRKQYYKETKQTFPLKDFVDQVYEKEPYKWFGKEERKKVKELLKKL